MDPPPLEHRRPFQRQNSEPDANAPYYHQQTHTTSDTDVEKSAAVYGHVYRSRPRAMPATSQRPHPRSPPLSPASMSTLRPARGHEHDRGYDDPRPPPLPPKSARQLSERHASTQRQTPTTASSSTQSAAALPTVMVFAPQDSTPPPPPSGPVTYYSQTVPASGNSNLRVKRTKTLLARLSSIASSRSSGSSKYNRVASPMGMHPAFKNVDDDNDEDDDYSGGMDVSTLVGPIEMQRLTYAGAQIPGGTTVYPSHTPEDALLEAKGHLTGGLGRGMGSFRAASSTEAIDRNTLDRSLTRSTKTSLGRTTTVKNELDPVFEEVVDLSHVAGFAHSDTGLTFEPQAPGEGGARSYYFPADPQMPDWRPVPMRWPYIVFLIVLALALAGIEEFLCQRSQQLSHGTQGGLLTFIDPQDVSNLEFFTWKYLPTLVLVAYGVLWQTADFEIKRLEPFYQLSQESGATAAESLNIDYLTFWGALVPFKALRHKQWAVFLSSTSTLLASTLTPVFQSAAVVLYPEQSKRIAGQPKFVRINPLWSRLMEGTLLLVAVCGILLLFQLRRRSGLLSDPKGIAGIAAMANRSHILTDFKGLDTANDTVIHKQLKYRRYILHKSSLWQGEYRLRSREEVDHAAFDNPQPIMLRLGFGILYIVCLLIFLGLIPVFMFTSANVVIQKLPFFLTACATLLQLAWSTLEGNVRLTEPFYILSRRHAPPSTLTLDYTGTVPGWLPLKAILNRHYIVFLVGFGSIMSQILTVVVSSFDVDGKKFFPGWDRGATSLPGTNSQNSTTPGLKSPLSVPGYGTDQTFNSFWVSFGLAISILFFLSIFASCVYVFRRHTFLPRQPGSIASVLAFIHQSKMLYDFVGTEEFGAERMTRHLEALGKSYGLGWYRGRDGEDHCGVDEEELLADYKHGEDFRRGRVNLQQVGTWEHY